MLSKGQTNIPLYWNKKKLSSKTFTNLLLPINHSSKFVALYPRKILTKASVIHNSVSILFFLNLDWLILRKGVLGLRRCSLTNYQTMLKIHHNQNNLTQSYFQYLISYKYRSIRDLNLYFVEIFQRETPLTLESPCKHGARKIQVQGKSSERSQRKTKS